MSSRSNRSNRSCERGRFEQPRLLGNTGPRRSLSSSQKPASALIENRSRSCGEVASMSTNDDVSCLSGRFQGSDSECILHALREENLRLREVNVEIREQSMQKHALQQQNQRQQQQQSQPQLHQAQSQPQLHQAQSQPQLQPHRPSPAPAQGSMVVGQSVVDPAAQSRLQSPTTMMRAAGGVAMQAPQTQAAPMMQVQSPVLRVPARSIRTSLGKQQAMVAPGTNYVPVGSVKLPVQQPALS